MIIWEGGTFYLEKNKVFNILDFLFSHTNVIGFISDFLNQDVFFDENHQQKQLIKQVLDFLKDSNEPWKGFFTQTDVVKYLKSNGFNEIQIDDHNDIEKQAIGNSIMTDNSVFFVTAFK